MSSWIGGRMRPALLVGALLLTSVVTGCRLEMFDQPKVREYEANPVFADSQSVRPHIEGTVSRGASGWAYEPSVYDDSGFDPLVRDTTGIAGLADLTVAGPDSSNPLPMTAAVLKRGENRYNIFCSPCHAKLGDGRGMIVQRGMPMPPTFHSDRLRQVKDAHFYDVITNGFGVMYSYASRIPPVDRWAIAHYVRALQLSQNYGGRTAAGSPSTSQRP